LVQINFGSRQISCKIVYYGPGLGGKTTNLRVIHEKAPSDHRGELTSIATEGDRTLFFDFLPIELGTVRGMTTKFQLYTVPGQIYYNATRKLVLAGADGLVFVADSQKTKMEENKESLRNLEENLREHGVDVREIPLVMQFNKRDLPEIEAVEKMNEELNPLHAPYFESVAVRGDGVFPTLRTCLKLVLANLEKDRLGVPAPAEEPTAAEPTTAVKAPTAATAAPAADMGGAGRKAVAAEAPRPAFKPRPGARAGREAGAALGKKGVETPARRRYIKAPRHGLPGWALVVLLGVFVGIIAVILWRLGILSLE